MKTFKKKLLKNNSYKKNMRGGMSGGAGILDTAKKGVLYLPNEAASLGVDSGKFMYDNPGRTATLASVAAIAGYAFNSLHVKPKEQNKLLEAIENVKKNPSSYNDISSSLKRNPNVVALLCTTNPKVIQYIDEDMKTKTKFKSALRNNLSNNTTLNKNQKAPLTKLL